MTEFFVDVGAPQPEFASQRGRRPRLARDSFEQGFSDGHRLVTSVPHLPPASDVLSDMTQNLAHVLQRSTAHATLMVGDIQWKIFVFGVSRIGPDLFVQMALVGPRTCTVTVRARAPLGNPATARRVLVVVRQWIISNDPSDQAYLELSPLNEMAS
jgi:hypothetical protein